MADNRPGWQSSFEIVQTKCIVYFIFDSRGNINQEIPLFLCVEIDTGALAVTASLGDWRSPPHWGAGGHRLTGALAVTASTTLSCCQNETECLVIFFL